MVRAMGGSLSTWLAGATALAGESNPCAKHVFFARATLERVFRFVKIELLGGAGSL